MRSTFKILFYINRQKVKADGNIAILCRITIDGKSATITTDEQCNPSKWNVKHWQKDQSKNLWVQEVGGKDLSEHSCKRWNGKCGLIKNHLQSIATNSTTLLAMSRGSCKQSRNVWQIKSRGNLSEPVPFWQKSPWFCRKKRSAEHTHRNNYRGVV